MESQDISLCQRENKGIWKTNDLSAKWTQEEERLDEQLNWQTVMASWEWYVVVMPEFSNSSIIKPSARFPCQRSS